MIIMHWNASICRICGENNENYHQIYSKDSTSTVENKIKKVLKLELFKDDFKPKQICNNCLMKLEDFHHFLEICHNTDRKFNSLLSEWSNDNIIDYTQQKMSVIVTPKATIDQLDCNEIDLYKDTVLPLDSINHDEMLDMVENVSYTTFDYLNPPGYYPEPTVLRHSSNYQQESSCSSSNVIINYSCQPPIEPDNFAYNGTGIDYSTYDRPSDDFRVIVAEKTKSESKFYECPHCERKFKRRGSLNCHVAIHTKIRPYICDICKKSYATKCDLTTHKKVHTDVYKCKFCSSTFPAPSKLERHLRTHTKTKPFKCDFKNCTKSFGDKCNLDAHKIVVHSTDYNYRCKVCLKAFKTNHKLKLHAKSHSDGTPYTCEICWKAYKYKSNLIQHLKKHNGYFCPHCDENCEGFAKYMKHKRICPNKKLI